MFGDWEQEFREWIQRHEPPWEVVRDEENPRCKDGPRDRWRAFKYHLPSKEGWPVIWLWSALSALQQEQSRRERIAQGCGRPIREVNTLLKQFDEARRMLKQMKKGKMPGLPPELLQQAQQQQRR